MLSEIRLSITQHWEISTLTSAFELVVLTDCPPGPDDLLKFLTISEFLIETSLYELNLEVESRKYVVKTALNIKESISNTAY